MKPSEDEVTDAARRKKMTETQRVVEATETMCHLIELIFKSTRCPDCRGKGKDTTGGHCTTCDGGGDVFHAAHTRLSGIEARAVQLIEKLEGLEAELREELARARANGAEPPEAPAELVDEGAGAGG